MLLAPQAYRPDIDGLRAISVLFVLLFHGFADAMPGGYIGVDVFFVISGYLITRQIHAQTNAGSFSFLHFYARRIRRIFPPLIVILAFVACYGFVRLDLADFTSLYRHIAAASVFMSNFVLWQESGYFDKQSELKPLLHLWSLAIEEQFYLLWPFVLTIAAAIARKYRDAAVWTLLLICIFSFAIQTYLAVTDSIAAFYSPLGRFWELGLGGLMALLQIESNPRWSQRSRDIVAMTSCLCLVACAFLFSKSLPLPGPMNVLPALCAAAMIAAGPESIVNHKLLARRPMVQLGLISYALYLWHWPLLAFARIEHDHLPMTTTLLLLGASVVLAAATHVTVERPIRRSRLRAMPVYLALAFLGLGGLGVILEKGTVQPGRLAQQAQIQDQVKTAMRAFNADGVPNQDCASITTAPLLKNKQYCRIWGTSDATRTVVVWGDSMSWSWMPAFITLVRDHGWRVVHFSHVGCAPLTNVRRPDLDSDCGNAALQPQIIDTIRTLKPAVTFLIARWNLYYHGHIRNDILVEKSFITDGSQPATAAAAKIAFERHLPYTVKQLAAVSNVVVFKDTPVLNVPVDVGLTRQPDTFEPSTEEHARFEADINRIIDDTITQTPKAVAFNPGQRLCDTSKCNAYLDGLPAYIDEVHLTAHATLKFVGDILSLGTAQPN